MPSMHDDSMSYPKLMFHQESHGDVVREPELIARLNIGSLDLVEQFTWSDDMNAKIPPLKSIKANWPGQIHPQQGGAI